MPQSFYLRRVSKLETFLHSRLEASELLHNKYCRSVNILNGLCAALVVVCVVTGTVGSGLLVSEVGVV